MNQKAPGGKPSFAWAVFALFAWTLALGCGDEDRGGAAGLPEAPPSLEERLSGATAFLAQGKGDAARSAFRAILEDYPESTEAHFGVALADELRFAAVLDELLSLVLDPLNPVARKDPIDVGAIIVDYAENFLEPLTREILGELEFCRRFPSFRFSVPWLPLEILGQPFLIYAGEYDAGDVLLQSAEFNLLAAGLNTVLSADLGFDFQIVLDHADKWGGMEVLEIVVDVVDLILEILNDPDFPNFLRLREEGSARMPRAGLEMGEFFDLFRLGSQAVRSGPTQDVPQVSGCNDRNGNRTCDPQEFVHGILYSLPLELLELLEPVEEALRDSYWDGTEKDPAPDVPNPFTLDRLNPILTYLGVPCVLPSLAIDLGSLYAHPDMDGIHDQLRLVFQIIRLLLGLLPIRAEPGPAAVDLAEDWPVEESPLTAAGVPQGPPTVGLETVTEVAALPYLRPTARTLQFSSHDPTGGNDDGFTPPNHLYVDENGEFVVFDQFGPGCIYRMWFTNTWSLVGNLRIYVDDMRHPVVEGPILLLFMSSFEPFSAPLVGNWLTGSGGCFSYLPIAFQQRCKVTNNVPPEFFGITYVRYDTSTPVESFSGAEDDRLLRDQWTRLGRDPKPEVPSLVASSGKARLEPGQKVDLLDRQGAGAVWRLFLKVEPLSQEAVEGLWILGRWDGLKAPSVEAPVGDFFGSHYVDEAPKGLLVGRDQDHFYCYFPMPFWGGALLGLEDRGDLPVAVSWEIWVAEEEYAPGAGYFKAKYREMAPVPVGEDYRIGLHRGRAGKFVGLTHTLRGPKSRWYLEGDERFYVDDAASPALYGTGTEDYFNGGWYFLMGPYTEPLFGNPSHRIFPEEDVTGAYRFHLGDAVQYLSEVRLGIQHGSDDTGENDRYASVAYYYELDEPLLSLTDSLDVGDAASESAHAYTAGGSTLTEEMVSFYEGEQDHVPVTDRGRVLPGASRFRVAVDPENNGVILRRRYDQATALQRAEVWVGGSYAGIWYNPESSPVLRWAEDDFALPASLTCGRASLDIRIHSQGETPWTEFAYWVYSVSRIPDTGSGR